MELKLNRVVCIGNLGADPVIRDTESGKQVCTFSIAVDRTFINSEGKRQEETDWIPVVVWGAAAKSCSQYLHKGSQVAVEGRLQSRSYQSTTGTTVRVLEVIAEPMGVKFLSRIGSNQEASTET